MAEEKKLEVKDLRISFTTANGKVQAVRDISFDLYKGETLAIVGESGSGKSVTSRAIMGILAGNAIKEGGKILYGDKDLMKTSEDEFHRIRGDKIAMVFQDPLSSLNPIMRVGQQLTEAMLLKNKTSRRESKVAMNRLFKALNENMTAAGVNDAKTDLEKFKKFGIRHSKLESEYTAALDYAKQAQAEAESVIIHIENKAVDKLSQDITDFCQAAKKSVSHFVVRDRAAELEALLGDIKSKTAEAKKSKDYSAVLEDFKKAKSILDEAVSFDAPNTFTLGYYLTFDEDKIPDMPVAELNELTHDKTENEFMNPFMRRAEKGVRYSSEKTDAARREAITILKAELPVFEKAEPDRKECEAAAKKMKAAVIKCLDPLEVIKDSETHTFESSIDYAVDLYFGGFKKNAKEEKRFTKATEKHEKASRGGKTPDWEVIPASYINLEAAHQDMVDTVKDMIAHFEAQLEANKTADFAQRTLDIVDNLKEQEQNSVYTITKSVAREKAIKLMESVGIDEPRRRFRQYPFEFSGGMRQRIVIAIALTANPDILICDEPTTALDVTIQAQILELINNLKRERDLSVIFITHDLGVVANMADRIAVMYAGKIVEYGTAKDIFYDPAHPYTWALLSSVPDLDTKEKLQSIPGTPPNMIYPPKGDAFADRNVNALVIDFEMQPPMFKISDTHYAATWLLHPDAPKIERPKIITERIERMQKKRGETK